MFETVSAVARAFELAREHSHLLMALWLAAFLLLERCTRAFAQPSRPRRWGIAAAFALLNHGAVSSLWALPLLAWAATLHLWSWPASVPGWLPVLLTVVVLDAAGYGFHRISHCSEFLWRFHQVHHLDEVMDATTGLRVHFAEKMMQAALYAGLIAALDLPLTGVVLHALAGYAFATFHHSNIRLPAWLEWLLTPVLITPAFHWPHHHERKENTNSNYGFILPWWDRLFGTYNPRRRTADWRMGLDYSPDLGCAELLAEPFRRVPLWERGHAAAEPAADRNTDDSVVSSAA